MKNIVLLSYGREADYRMAIFAVLSFWAWYSGRKTDVRIFIYTDNPEYFYPLLSDLAVEYELLSPSKLESMLECMSYIHRRKIAVIDEIYKRYPSDDLIFLDSDTIFRADALPWFQSFAPGKAFMHKAEYTFEEAVDRYASFNQEQYPKEFIKLIENKTFSVDKREVRFNKHQVSWNSGVLGLTKEVTSVMPDVFSLTAEFHEATQWNTCEQIAFSLVLQTRAEIIPCEQYVFHYWGQRQKRLISRKLISLLDDDFANLSLNEKLKIVKKTSINYVKIIKLDKIKEQSVNAFTNNNILSGCRHALRALTVSPFDVHFLHELTAHRKQK